MEEVKYIPGDLVMTNGVPLGFMTQTDAHYLFDNVFTKEFVKEMTDRGHDVTTMKFEISPKLPNYKRFNGLSEKYYGKKK